MDERVEAHAETLVEWSARIEAGDDVVLSVGPEAHELAVAVAGELGDRGANLLCTYSSGEISRAYLNAHGGDFAADPDFEAAMLERADAYLSLGGGRNSAATADVPEGRRSAYDRAREGIREARLDTDWVKTLHPTRSLAQRAGMAYEAYQEFLYAAVLRDWESLAAEQERLKELLEDTAAVRIVAEGTDITLDVSGRFAVNSCASVAYDSHNLPSGEVFTAPRNAEGHVTFDVPMTINDRRVRDAYLEFEGGEVVDFSAAQGESAIAGVLDTDDGAKRLGELGIGMNRGIDRPTDTILFDEKMAGTVHLALGRAYDDCIPEGEEGNQSATHTDLITTMGEGSRLELDGEAVQEDGRFVWE
jgi:aminopeptidase